MSFTRGFTHLFVPAGVLVAALLAPGIGLAQEATKVLVVPYAPLYDSIPRATGDRIAGILSEGLRLDPGVELVQLPEGSEQAAPTSMLATEEQKQGVVDGKAELERGKSLLERRRVKPAFDAFEKAISLLEANYVALEDVDPLVEALLKRSVALYLMGREAEAAEGSLPVALKLQPSLRLEAGPEYAQVFIDLVNRVRAGLAEEGHGSLRVDTTPPGAGVWVDGRDALTSPVMVTGLIPGTHYVTIKLPSTDAYTTRVEILRDETFHITPDAGAASQTGATAALLNALGTNNLDAEGETQVKALAAQTGAEIVVIGGAYASEARMGLVTYAYDTRREGFIPLQRITLDRDMLGATIEINRIANQLLAYLGDEEDSIALVGIPQPMAADARPGAEKINEVDFAVNLAAPAAAPREERRGTVAPSGARRPVGSPRVPVGGGGTAPEASIEEPADEPVAVAPAPAPEPDLDFNFNLPQEEDFGQPVEAEGAAAYSYSGGVSIEDETALEVEPSSKGSLLTKWWFWTAAGVVAGGAVGIAALSGGGSPSGPTGNVSW